MTTTTTTTQSWTEVHAALRAAGAEVNANFSYLYVNFYANGEHVPHAAAEVSAQPPIFPGQAEPGRALVVETSWYGQSGLRGAAARAYAAETVRAADFAEWLEGQSEETFQIILRDAKADMAERREAARSRVPDAGRL